MASLTEIHSTSNPDALHVIFVHGLGGDSRGTWMHNKKDHTTLWPSWIGEDVDCNVWVAGYGAAATGWLDAAMHLADQGEAFFSALQVEPKLQKRKIVLVGHSLGGLVIKSGMTQAQTLGDPRREAVLADIAGVVFIGTPHQGSSLATIAAYLGPVARINPQVVNMASDDAWLKLLNGQFKNLQAQRSFSVRVFFETRGILIGRNLWRFKLGARVTIVNRNSSDPGIAGVIPTGIEGDHFEIAKPNSRQDFAHKALVAFLKSVTDTPPPNSPAAAPAPTRWPERDELTRGMRNASAPLLSWPSTLPDGTWLVRPELGTLKASLNDSETSTHFLLGEPGCGKSSLLVRLAHEKQAEGWAVLAIKADRLPADALDRDALNRHLDIGADIAAVLRHFGETEPVLLIIDQLDALADLVVQQSARLRVLLDLVQSLSDAPGVHTVISCRSFEQKHDPALRNLNANPLTLELPDWLSVLPVLVARGLHADAWNVELQQVLRSPHALDVFLSLLEGATEPAALKSFQGLLEKQWETQVLSDTSGKRRNTLRHLAKLMAEREVLGLPMAIVEEHFAEIQVLTASGLLRVDKGPGRVEFRHQTLYEFVRARTFLEESGSLTEVVARQQDSLRIRPQLWHALGYFRGASPEEYGSEVGKLWQAELRPHLKMLLIEFLGRQTVPLAAEQRFVDRSLSDKWFAPRFIGAAFGSPGWFAFLAQTHLPGLMASGDAQAQTLVPLLRQALHFDAGTVVELVHRHWLPDTTRDSLSWQVLGMGDVAPQPGLWLDTLVLVAGRTPISERAIGYATGVVSAAFPDEAPRLIAAWLKSQIDVAKAQLSVPTSGDDVAAAAASVTKNIQATLEARQFHEMEAIAEAAPRAFVLLIWPLLMEALSYCSPIESDAVLCYRQSSGLLFQDLDEEESRNERPLFRSMQLAVRTWAEKNALEFLDFADAQDGSDLLLLHRLAAVGRLAAAKHFPLRVFRYLAADSRRLVLGPYLDVHKESVALIEAVSPLLDEGTFQSLEAMAIAWQYYKHEADAEGDASVRQRRMRSGRQHRLRLLRAIPLARRSAAVQRLVGEEERAFPGLASSDVSFMRGGWIGSPISAEQMDKATEADVLNLFSELSDESAWDHPRDRMKGGAIQAGRELASLAELNLEKTIRIVRALKPASNEIPVATVLRELVPAGVKVQEFYALVEELEDKGFVGRDFRRDAAYAIASTGQKESPVPESLIDRLENWLVPSNAESSDSIDTNANDVNSAVLWGNRSLFVLPDGNYPTLSALTSACLSSVPPRIDRWLGILERHVTRQESTKVWEALLQRELMQLPMVNSLKAESFVDQLVQRFPAIVDGNSWIYFLADANHWAKPTAIQRWVMHTVEAAEDKQGVGELIALRHALFPAEIWSRDLIVTIVGGSTSTSLGLAHGVAHMWHEPMTRPVVHPVLLRLLQSDDEKILNALAAVFMHDGFTADQETRELLETFSAYPSVLKNGRAEQLPELLAKLITAEPEIVCRVAHALLDTAGDQMGNIATSWYLSTEWLLDIALQLQDMGDTERTAGSALFERMLEFNIPQAREMTLDLDKRMPAGDSPRAPVRRRSRAQRPKPARQP